MDEATLILQRAQNAGLGDSEYGYHLCSKVSVLNYVRIADDIKAHLPSGKILDWGCGYGQMSFLLQRRGLTVYSYDIGNCVETRPSAVFPEITIARGVEPVQLPFADDAFDAALSCGVLEHVPDDAGSLVEVARVVRPGGQLFIYNLPQSSSYKEFVLARLGRGYVHERKYTVGGTMALLKRAGWQVPSVRRTGMLPQNLTPMPGLRRWYNRFARPILLIDRALSAVPGLNYVAEALEFVAVKPNTRETSKQGHRETGGQGDKETG